MEQSRGLLSITFPTNFFNTGTVSCKKTDLNPPSKLNTQERLDRREMRKKDHPKDAAAPRLCGCNDHRRAAETGGLDGRGFWLSAVLWLKAGVAPHPSILRGIALRWMCLGTCSADRGPTRWTEVGERDAPGFVRDAGARGFWSTGGARAVWGVGRELHRNGVNEHGEDHGGPQSGRHKGWTILHSDIALRSCTSPSICFLAEETNLTPLGGQNPPPSTTTVPGFCPGMTMNKHGNDLGLVVQNPYSKT